MSRDDLVSQLMLLVAQGVRVPEQAFEIARTIPLERFERSGARVAALTVLRMGAQRRFGLPSVRNAPARGYHGPSMEGLAPDSSAPGRIRSAS